MANLSVARFRRAAAGLSRTVALGELLNPAGGIDKTLFAGEKRVTLRADVELQVLTERGPGLDDIAATAGSSDRLVLRVYISFHCQAPCQRRRHPISGPAPVGHRTCIVELTGFQLEPGQKIGGHLTRRGVISNRAQGFATIAPFSHFLA